MSTDLLTDVGDRLDRGADTGLPSSGAILDAAADGLAFFRTFGPLYAAHTGTRFDYPARIAAPFDRGREVAFGKLRVDAETLATLGNALGEHDVDLRNDANSVLGCWQGPAADGARDQLAQFLHRTESAWQQLTGFAAVLRAVCAAAERIVLTKARTVHRLAAGTVGGLTAPQVRLLLDTGKPRPAALAQLCAIAPGSLHCTENPNVMTMVRRDARNWLDTVFVPFYRARLAAFDAACARADDDLTHAWRLLDDALSTVELVPDSVRVRNVSAPMETTRMRGTETTARPSEHTNTPMNQLGSGGAFLPPLLPGIGGALGALAVYQPKVRRTGDPLAGAQPRACEPVIGAGKPFQDDSAKPDPKPDPKPPKEKTQTVWELGKDGELTCKQIPSPANSPTDSAPPIGSSTNCSANASEPRPSPTG